MDRESRLASQYEAAESEEIDCLNSSSAVSERSSHVITEESRSSWYSGVFGKFDIRTKRVFTARLSGAQDTNDRVIAEENAFWIRSSLVRFVFEVQFSNLFWRISRALSVYPV